MAEWSQEKLRAVAAQRREARDKLKPVERAALAYARWQNITNEEGIDTGAEKKLLDETIDAMEPDEWKSLQNDTMQLDEPAIRGLMAYSMKRAMEQLKVQSNDVDKMLDWPVGDGSGTGKRKKKRYDKGM